MTNNIPPEVRLGTRTSQLALIQTQRVIALLSAAWPGLRCTVTPFVTEGDRTLDRALPELGGKGVFTAELETALLSGRIDLAVHSLKDLPVENSPGLTLGALCDRIDVRDGLVAANGWTLATLPKGSVVGTCSTRRQAQLLALRPDLLVKPIRGNVPNRIEKVRRGDYDATLLAAAGLLRLGMADAACEWLTLDAMLPAPGQAALAVQCRADDAATLALLAALDDRRMRAAVTAERTFLHALGGGCAAPVAAYASISEAVSVAQPGIDLAGLVATLDGRTIVRVVGSGADPVELGHRLAQQARERGAAEILADG